MKILLATLLINHTGELGINSSYYPIYYVPVVTAAIYFGPWARCCGRRSLRRPTARFFIRRCRNTPYSAGRGRLAIRILFFFLAAMVVNRFTLENRRKTMQYQQVAEELTETNRHWNWPRRKRGVRNGWRRWVSCPQGWRMKSAIRWA